MRMASRYGHAWVSQYGASPAGIAAAEWRSTLAGMDADQIRKGFRADALRGEEWPPSSTRFRAMCFDIPTLAEVSLAFRQRDYDAPFVRLVYQFLDTYRFKNSPWDKADRLLRDAYNIAREHILAGGELPMKPVAFIANDRAAEAGNPASPEVVAEHVAKVGEILGLREVEA
jgi:hypothetical protein